MKSLSINTLIAIVCFTLGYVFYPVVNESNVELEPTLVNKKEVEDNFQIVKTQKSVSTTKSEILAASNLEVLPNVEEGNTQIDTEGEQVQTTDKENILDETVIALQKELKEWSVDHKDRIDELVTANMSSETSEHMKSKISQDNDFLSEPPIEQDSTEDDTWAYNMEQQLKLLIDQHELSDKFELLNLSCKQLMCDILGIEKEGSTWMKLYFSLLKNAPMVNFPDGNNAPKSVMYMDNNVAVVYSQIKFKSS